MRRLAALLVFWLLPVAVQAQPFTLPPATADTLRALVEGLRRVGWLGDSPEEVSLRCPVAGDDGTVAPLRFRGDTLRLPGPFAEREARAPYCTRAALLYRAGLSTLDRRPWGAGIDPFVPRTAADVARGHRIVDTLASTGIVPRALIDTLRRANADPRVWAERPFACNSAWQRALCLASALVEDAEWLHPSVLRPGVERLVALGLMSSASAERLFADGAAGRFRPARTVAYLDRAFPTDVIDSERARVDLLPVSGVIVDVVRRLRAAGVADVPLDTAHVFVERIARGPRLLVNGRRYPLDWPIRYSLDGVFNALLRDVRSPYRVVQIRRQSGRPQDWLVALTRTEEEATEARDWDLMSYDRRPAGQNSFASAPIYARAHLDERYDTPPIDTLEARYDRLVAAGFFAHEPQAMVPVWRADLTMRPFFLNSWDDKHWRASYEADGIEPPRHPYAAAVRDAARISHGAFRPVGIRERHERRSRAGHVQFEASGQVQRVSFARPAPRFRGDDAGLDANAIRAIYRAANEGVTGGRFVRVAGEDDYFFLTAQQRATLESIGMHFEEP